MSDSECWPVEDVWAAILSVLVTLVLGWLTIVREVPRRFLSWLAEWAAAEDCTNWRQDPEVAEPRGLSAEEAAGRARALQNGSVAYLLRLWLRPGHSSYTGECTVQFSLSETDEQQQTIGGAPSSSQRKERLFVDFSGDCIERIELNGCLIGRDGRPWLRERVKGTTDPFRGEGRVWWKRHRIWIHKALLNTKGKTNELFVRFRNDYSASTSSGLCRIPLPPAPFLQEKPLNDSCPAELCFLTSDPGHAHRVFPCFDQPGIPAKCDVAIASVRHFDGWPCSLLHSTGGAARSVPARIAEWQKWKAKGTEFLAGGSPPAGPDDDAPSLTTGEVRPLLNTGTNGILLKSPPAARHTLQKEVPSGLYTWSHFTNYLEQSVSPSDICFAVGPFMLLDRSTDLVDRPQNEGDNSASLLSLAPSADNFQVNVLVDLQTAATRPFPNLHHSEGQGLSQSSTEATVLARSVMKHCLCYLGLPDTCCPPSVCLVAVPDAIERGEMASAPRDTKLKVWHSIPPSETDRLEDGENECHRPSANSRSFQRSVESVFITLPERQLRLLLTDPATIGSSRVTDQLDCHLQLAAALCSVLSTAAAIDRLSFTLKSDSKPSVDLSGSNLRLLQILQNFIAQKVLYRPLKKSTQACSRSSNEYVDMLHTEASVADPKFSSDRETGEREKSEEFKRESEGENNDIREYLPPARESDQEQEAELAQLNSELTPAEQQRARFDNFRFVRVTEASAADDGWASLRQPLVSTRVLWRRRDENADSCSAVRTASPRDIVGLAGFLPDHNDSSEDQAAWEPHGEAEASGADGLAGGGLWGVEKLQQLWLWKWLALLCQLERKIGETSLRGIIRKVLLLTDDVIEGCQIWGLVEMLLRAVREKSGTSSDLPSDFEEALCCHGTNFVEVDVLPSNQDGEGETSNMTLRLLQKSSPFRQERLCRQSLLVSVIEHGPTAGVAERVVQNTAIPCQLVSTSPGLPFELPVPSSSGCYSPPTLLFNCDASAFLAISPSPVALERLMPRGITAVPTSAGRLAAWSLTWTAVRRGVISPFSWVTDYFLKYSDGESCPVVRQFSLDCLKRTLVVLTPEHIDALRHRSPEKLRDLFRPRLARIRASPADALAAWRALINRATDGWVGVGGEAALDRQAKNFWLGSINIGDEDSYVMRCFEVMRKWIVPRLCENDSGEAAAIWNVVCPLRHDGRFADATFKYAVRLHEELVATHFVYCDDDDNHNHNDRKLLTKNGDYRDSLPGGDRAAVPNRRDRDASVEIVRRLALETAERAAQVLLARGKNVNSLLSSSSSSA